jgi:hypothetical protein
MDDHEDTPDEEPQYIFTESDLDKIIQQAIKYSEE